MKLLGKIILGLFLLFVVLTSSFFLWVYVNHVTPILMYHQVLDADNPSGEQVRPYLFDRQMRTLKKFNYRVIGLEDYVQAYKKGVQISRKAVVITFDDGKEDIYTNAFPILKKYDYPAIVFLPAAKIGTPGYLTWQQVKEMAAHKITFGSHTKNEKYLPDLSEADQRIEIFESKKMIEKETRAPVTMFSYPTGGFSDLTKQLVKQAGYEAGVTTNRGYKPQNTDLYELHRVRLSNSDDNELYIWVKLAGYSKVFKKGKKPH